MESGPPVKPPWELVKSAWQSRVRAAPPWPTQLLYGPWTETDQTALKAAKEWISPLEASHRWELLKKMVNPYEMVFTQDDPAFHPSLSLIKPLSRSYFKLIEMMDVLQFFEGLPKQTQNLRSAHIAEGPGGFIQAFITVAERMRKRVTSATAMTLKPTDTYVPGWRRAANFLHHHREVRLHYGVDGTGDIYQQGNQDSFVKAVAPGVHFFTADGGFDFSVNYAIQEQRVFHLLTCSATIGLRSLLQGGAMVLKLFDVFSESTKLLVLILGRCFTHWTLYKPALSRPCNSERYFLGRGFKGVSPAFLALLLEFQTHSLQGAFPRGFAEVATAEEAAFLKQIEDQTQTDQLAALRRAEEFVRDPTLWYTEQLPKDFQTSLTWCYRFRVPTQRTTPLTIAPPTMTGHSESTSGPGAAPR